MCCLKRICLSTSSTSMRKMIAFVWCGVYVSVSSLWCNPYACGLEISNILLSPTSHAIPHGASFSSTNACARLLDTRVVFRIWCCVFAWSTSIRLGWFYHPLQPAITLKPALAHNGVCLEVTYRWCRREGNHDHFVLLSFAEVEAAKFWNIFFYKIRTCF